jgi:hypothetical protein
MFMFRHSTGHSEPSEKQVAMIAQKIIDAKYSQEKGRRFVTAPDARAFTFGTTLRDHFPTLLNEVIFELADWGAELLCLFSAAHATSQSHV